MEVLQSDSPILHSGLLGSPMARIASEPESPNAPPQPKPVPVEHVESSHSRKASKDLTPQLKGISVTQVSPQSHASFKPRPSPIQTSGISTAAQRRNKSLSMSFPVLPSASPSQRDLAALSALSLSASKQSGTPRSEAPSPTNASFLTALAAQERQVLELKEELQKAEEALVNLKKQWMSHEATKRRDESRKSQQLQPLRTNSPRTRSKGSDPSPTWMYEEMERRKALMGGPKTKHRRAFSGSRHTRALSLLSPDKLGRTLVGSPSLTGLGIQNATGNPERPAPPDRSHTSPDSQGLVSEELPSITQSPQRDKFARQSLMMANEFKEGLWTFFEDLKQATYGEEARAATLNSLPQRKPLLDTTGRPSSRRSARSTILRQTWEIRPHDDAEPLEPGSEFWKESGLLPPPDPTASTTSLSSTAKTDFADHHARPKTKAPQTKTPQKSAQAPLIRDYDSESWESWSTPGGLSPARSNSSASKESQGQESSLGRGPSTQTSASSSMDATQRGKRDSIPWPALNKLKPGQLRRTASHLMGEWERSLVSPEENNASQQQQRHARPDGKGMSAATLSP